MTTYNNSYDSDGLFGDPEGDEQERWQRKSQWLKRRAEYLARPFCSIPECQNHTAPRGDLCTHHFIQTLDFGRPKWAK